MISTYEDWKTDYSTSYDKLIMQLKTKSLNSYLEQEKNAYKIREAAKTGKPAASVIVPEDK